MYTHTGRSDVDVLWRLAVSAGSFGGCAGRVAGPLLVCGLIARLLGVHVLAHERKAAI